MVTSNILQRVLRIKNNNECGTAFTVDVKDKQYLISAKHIFHSAEEGVEIKKDGIWETLPEKPLFCKEDADIIIFPLDQPITPRHELIMEIKGVCLSQDAYFLGFPFNFEMGSREMNAKINNNHPIPFVKKCIISAFDCEPNPKLIFLDGHNNEGFSGGPVVFTHRDTKKLHIAGVVSSYICDKNRGNLGLFCAHSISYVTDIIGQQK